jgi:thioredoxin-related protein
MKKQYLLIVILIGVLQSLNAQSNSEPPYKRFPTVPPFNLLQPDSTTFTKDSLQKGKPVLLMYFSPTCDHCQHQVKDMISQSDSFKDIQIILATYSPMNELVDFINTYALTRFAELKAGRDTRYMLQPFYKISGLPYQALYDKSGNLMTTFEGNVKVDHVLSAFQKKDQGM